MENYIFDLESFLIFGVVSPNFSFEFLKVLFLSKALLLVYNGFMTCFIFYFKTN